MKQLIQNFVYSFFFFLSFLYAYVLILLNGSLVDWPEFYRPTSLQL
jgi:hypothetical protein